MHVQYFYWEPSKNMVLDELDESFYKLITNIYTVISVIINTKYVCIENIYSIDVFLQNRMKPFYPLLILELWFLADFILCEKHCHWV